MGGGGGGWGEGKNVHGLIKNGPSKENVSSHFAISCRDFENVFCFQCVKFHHNCTYLATASADRTCRLWDLQSGNCVRLFTAHKVRYYCTPSNERLRPASAHPLNKCSSLHQTIKQALLSIKRPFPFSLLPS